MTSVYLVGSLVVTIVEVFAEHDEWAIVVLTQVSERGLSKGGRGGFA